MRRRVSVTGSAFDASNRGGRASLYASVEAIRKQARLRLRRLRDVDVGRVKTVGGLLFGVQ